MRFLLLLPWRLLGAGKFKFKGQCGCFIPISIINHPHSRHCEVRSNLLCTIGNLEFAKGCFVPRNGVYLVREGLILKVFCFFTFFKPFINTTIKSVINMIDIIAADSMYWYDLFPSSSSGDKAINKQIKKNNKNRGLKIIYIHPVNFLTSTILIS